jgi:hypothetical protein
MCQTKQKIITFNIIVLFDKAFGCPGASGDFPYPLWGYDQIAGVSVALGWGVFGKKRLLAGTLREGWPYRTGK